MKWEKVRKLSRTNNNTIVGTSKNKEKDRFYLFQLEKRKSKRKYMLIKRLIQ